MIFVLVSGGRAEERQRAQVRSLVYGAARIHRGVCPCAGGLPAHGPRHGGGQEVPVSCESYFVGLLLLSGGLSDLSAWTLLELQITSVFFSVNYPIDSSQ